MERTDIENIVNGKTIFILDNLELGGSQRLTQDIIDLTIQNNNNIHLLVLSCNDKLNLIAEYGNRIMFLNLKHYDIITNIIQIYDKIKDYDYIITSMNESNLYLSILKSLGVLRGRTVSIIHGRDSFFIEDSYLEKKIKEIGILYNIKIKVLLQLFYRNLDAFICVSSDLKDYLIKTRKVDPKKIQVQHFGTKIDYNLRYYFLEKIFYQYRNRFVILYSGRVTYAKGLEDMIIALLQIKERIPNILLIIVGEGELEEKLKQEVREKNLYESVIFIPFMDNVLTCIAICDVYISLSSYESTNIGIQQAMLLGKIVLCSDVGGIRDLVDDNYSGILYDRSNINDFVDKLYFIYKNYDKMKKELGYNARNKILEDFNLYKNITKIKNLIYND